MQSDNVSYGGILSSSRKIKKAQSIKRSQNEKPCSSSSSPSDSDEKKYQTFDVSDRIQILSRLKTGLIQLSGLSLSEESLEANEVLGLIKKMKLPAYNNLIKKVFSYYNANLDFSPKALIQWRKKIVNWFKSSEKPETRGGVVVSGNLKEPFVQEVTAILGKMQTRCFPTLRGFILPTLMKMKYEEDGKKIDENTCSKHWWFNFQKKHPEIKEIWSKIPLERTYNKMISKGLITQSSCASATQQYEQSSLSSPISDIKTVTEEVDNFINYSKNEPKYDFAEMDDEIDFDALSNLSPSDYTTQGSEAHNGTPSNQEQQFHQIFFEKEESSPNINENDNLYSDVAFCLSPLDGDQDTLNYGDDQDFNFS